jgi:polyphosphate glucokinase
VKRQGAKVLVIDVGGTNIKVLAEGQQGPLKIPSGPKMTAQAMVQQVLNATHDWDYDRIAMGYPAPVLDNKPVLEPHNLAPGWVRFDFQKAFGKPLRMINDAAMQALGSYQGGRMLFLGIGTGLGSALVIEGIVQPMELAHLPYRNGRTYEDYVGLRGLERLGKKRWRVHVLDVVERLAAALDVDYVILGGGNAKLLKTLPKGARLGANENAFLGGVKLWEDPEDRQGAHTNKLSPGLVSRRTLIR